MKTFRNYIIEILNEADAAPAPAGGAAPPPAPGGDA